MSWKKRKTWLEKEGTAVATEEEEDEDANCPVNSLNKGDVVERFNADAKFSKMRCRNRQIKSERRSRGGRLS
jgi:hypothetical protein